MKFKFAYISKLIFISNIFFAILLFSSYLAPLINPKHFWPIAFIGLGYPFLLIINIVYFFYWLIGRNVLALISGITVMLGLNIFLDCFGFRFKISDNSIKRPAHNVRVMTYNVHGFVMIDRPDSLSYQKIINLVKVQNPDLVTFEEFCSRNTAYRFCDSLKKVLNNGQYYFEPFIKAQNDSTGLAILSKYPIINRNIIRLSDEDSDNQGISVDIKFNSGILRVYCFHLQSIMLRRRDLKFMRKNTYFDKHSAHETFEKIKSAYISRAQQVLFIKEQLEKCPYPYILTGDFNDTPNSYAVHQMADGLTNSFKEKGYGWGVTYNAGFPIFQIDYILASPNYNVAKYQIIKQKISDHYPVVADLSFNK